MIASILAFRVLKLMLRFCHPIWPLLLKIGKLLKTCQKSADRILPTLTESILAIQYLMNDADVPSDMDENI